MGKMDLKKKIFLLKMLLFISGIAFIVMITPDKRANFLIYILGSIATFGIIFMKEFHKELIQRAFTSNYLVGALLLTAALGFNFYANWTIPEGGSAATLAELLGVDRGQLVLVLGCIIVIAATPIVSLGLAGLIPAARQSLKQLEKGNWKAEFIRTKFNLKKAILTLTGIYVLGISAILLANFNYIDDMGRAFLGFKNWGDYSRILSNSFSTYVHMGHYLTDVAPWSQIVACTITAVAGIILLACVYERTQFSIWELLALVPLGLNPYFLECISYKFDSPYMALSIFGAAFPLLFLEARPLIAIYATMVGTVVVCTSYQAAAGVLPMAVLMIVLRKWMKKEDVSGILRYLLKAVAGYLLGLIFFRVVIMKPTDEAITVNSNDLPPIRELFPTIVKNLKTYYELLFQDFKPIWLILIGCLFVIGIVLIMQQTKQKKSISFLLTFVMYFCWICMAFGPYVALKKSVFVPRAMYGIGCMITCLCVFILEQKTKKPKLLFQAPALLLGLMFFTFSFTYGNALRYQKEYTEFRIQQTISDLSSLGLLTDETEICLEVKGDIGRAPVIRNMPNNYNMLNRLLPQTFSGNNGWFSYRFYNYYGLKNVRKNEGETFVTMELPVMKDNIYQVIRVDGDKVLVELK